MAVSEWKSDHRNGENDRESEFTEVVRAQRSELRHFTGLWVGIEAQASREDGRPRTKNSGPTVSGETEGGISLGVAA
jgi:hypothetical protein